MKMQFKLDLTPFMNMHSIVNCECLQLNEPSMLDDEKVLPSLEDLDVEVRAIFTKNVMLEKNET